MLTQSLHGALIACNRPVFFSVDALLTLIMISLPVHGTHVGHSAYTEKAKVPTHQAVRAVWIGLEGACYVLNGN